MNSTGQDRHIDLNALPTLYRDPSFWGMTAAQFLGAFNDTIFKQLVLLLCVQVLLAGGRVADLQTVALLIFSLPFILFSGSAGWLADRVPKRTVIVSCKVAEVAIMGAGGAAFMLMKAPSRLGDGYATTGVPLSVFAVLFLMGTHSAVFGPAKYGILPEMVRGRDLPRFNGAVQMTTFLALILGMAGGGFLLDAFGGRLWMASVVCVGIAMAGTGASLLVRWAPAAEPRLRFTPSSLFIPGETWRLLRSDRKLRGALLVYAFFWFLGGVVQPTVNRLGKVQFGASNLATGVLAASMGVGIGIGCVLAGTLSRGSVRFGLVRTGAWGMLGCLALLALPGGNGQHLLGYYGSMPPLAGLGLFAGLFAVPLQVFIQARPPEDQKGRMIGSMNLVTWIGIIASAIFYGTCEVALTRFGLPISLVFGLSALLLLPLALLYRPADSTL